MAPTKSLLIFLAFAVIMCVSEMYAMLLPILAMCVRVVAWNGCA